MISQVAGERLSGSADKQVVEEGGARPRQARHHDRLFDDLLGDAGEALAVLHHLQPLDQGVRQPPVRPRRADVGELRLGVEVGDQHLEGPAEELVAPVGKAGRLLRRRHHRARGGKLGHAVFLSDVGAYGPD